MKTLIKIAALVLLFAGPAMAQEATLTTPEIQPTGTKHVVKGFYLEQGYAFFSVEVKSAGDVVIRTYRVELPNASFPTATVNAALVALDTAIGGETGSATRRGFARATKFLLDNGILPAATVNP